MNKKSGENSNMDNIIETRQLSKTYRLDKVEVSALRDVDLNITKGEFVAIVGASGSGKSTLLHILGLMDVPTSGQTFFQGKPTSGLNDSERTKLRLKEIGFVFQTFNLLPNLTSFGNVEIALRLAGIKGKDRKERTQNLLKKVGLEHRLNHLPRELSGGERQRVAIARALANNPGVIMADEPTGNLDSVAGTAIVELFQRLNQAGQTIILVTHNMEITRLATRTLVMRDGKFTC
jgi:putative ABC transport system ATP-binding protein